MENEETKTPVERTDEASGDSEKKNDVVRFETFQKLLNEKKSVQSKAAEYESKIKALEEEKLIRENNQAELAERYKKDAETWKNKFQNSHNKFAWTTLENGIKSEATKQGCSDVDLLLRAFDEEELKSLSPTDDYKYDDESLKSAVAAMKIKKPLLFSSSQKKVANGNPNVNDPSPDDDKMKDLSKLSDEELAQLYKKTYGTR